MDTRGILLIPESPPSESDTLQAIGEAFFAHLDHGAAPWLLAVLAFVLVAGFGWLFLWLRRETRKEVAEEEDVENRHQMAMVAAQAGIHRPWVNVPAHCHVVVQHAKSDGKFRYEEC